MPGGTFTNGQVPTLAQVNAWLSSVATADIADLAVTTAKLNDLAVTTGKIAAATVTVAKLASTPHVSVRHSISQSIATATDTALAFDTERFDTDTMHDTATNNSRLTATTAGKYRISANVSFASNATGYRAVWLRKNGNSANPLARVVSPPVNGAITELCVSILENLVAADYVEVMVYQNSGGALNCEAAGANLPRFDMERVSS